MDEKNWKVLAIIFICLFIIESIIFYGMYMIGTNTLKKQEDCGLKCFMDDDCEAYQFDLFTEKCLFYKDDEIIKEFVVE